MRIENCECSFKGQTSKAIYRWREDSIFLDGAVPGDPRPTRFGTEKVQRIPNIGAIYGVEETGGTRGLVLELVEGTSLAERLAHGPVRWARFTAWPAFS